MGTTSVPDAQEPANMGPVLNMLDSWGAETPFAQISESAVGGSVLAVSTGQWHNLVRLAFLFSIASQCLQHRWGFLR